MATATRRVVRTMPQMFIETVDVDQGKLKVAAYARVSTEKEEQEDSFERQVEHYKQLIASKPEWKYVDIYADPGISGTRAEKRPDFLRMIEDCRAGKIQKILVKSISRFARNTVDALNYIRELKDLGISVYFESENIDTLTPGGEVLLTILAAMAEQESRTISSNIRWAYQRKFQNGDIVLNTGLMLGYRKVGKDEDGHDVFEINEEEAEIVRRIYREFIAGYSITQIAKRLAADGIKTKLGKDKWQHNVIVSILTNEKYTGNALLGKTWKPDVLTKYRQKNDGKKAPIYYVEDTHPAIIEKDMFELAKKEMERRRGSKEQVVGGGRFTSKYPFSGLIECGTCGGRLRRHVRTMGTGKKVASWGCATRITNGRQACDTHHINETVLEATYLAALRDLLDNASDVVEAVKEGAELALEPENRAAIERVEAEIVGIQEAVLELHRAKQRMELGAAEYTAKVKEYSELMKAKEAERDALQDTAVKYTEVKTWLDTFMDQIMQSTSLTKVGGTTMKMLVEKIIARDTGIEVIFKCGVSVEHEYVK